MNFQCIEQMQPGLIRHKLRTDFVAMNFQCIEQMQQSARWPQPLKIYGQEMAVAWRTIYAAVAQADRAVAF